MGKGVEVGKAGSDARAGVGGMEVAAGTGVCVAGMMVLPVSLFLLRLLDFLPWGLWPPGVVPSWLPHYFLGKIQAPLVPLLL